MFCPEENICTDEVFCSADAFNFLLFASAENDSCCRFTKCHPHQEDELQQLKNQHFLGGHLSDFVLGSYRETAASSQESSLCCHFLILLPNPDPVLSRGGPSRPQGNATAGMTPGFGFPFRRTGSHSQLGELGQERSKQGLSTGLWLQRSMCHAALWYPFTPAEHILDFRYLQIYLLIHFWDVFDAESSSNFNIPGSHRTIPQMNI